MSHLHHPESNIFHYSRMLCAKGTFRPPSSDDRAQRTLGSNGQVWTPVQRVPDVQELELPEVPVVGVQRAHTVLVQDRGQVRIRDEVAARRDAPRGVGVGTQEAFFLPDRAAVGQSQQGLDVVQGVGWRKRAFEVGCVRGDPQLAHDGQPRQAEDLAAARAVGQESTGLAVKRAAFLGRVQKDVDVDRDAQGSSA
jgi:hypothetical protein